MKKSISIIDRVSRGEKNSMTHGIGETEDLICQEKLLTPGTFLTHKKCNDNIFSLS